MFLNLISPELGLAVTFGSRLEGDLANIIVRNWGALIGLIGGMLIYGAYNETNRSFILVIASISKTIFIFLNLIYGQSFFEKSALALVFDSIIICIYIAYLFGQKKKSRA